MGAEPNMTLEQALNTLVQAAALAALPKRDHVLIEQAAQQLEAALTELEALRERSNEMALPAE